MERERNTLPIRDVLERYLLKHKHLQYEVKTRQALKLWGEIVDDYVRRNTEAVIVKKRTLFVHTTSAVLANELQMRERELLKKLNTSLEVSLIDRIVFKSGFFLKGDKKEEATGQGEARLPVKVLKSIDNTVKNVNDDDLRKVLKDFLTSVALKNENR